MSNNISRSTVILRVQNSAGTLADPTTQLSDGSVAINAFMKGGVIDSKAAVFTLVRSNVTTADTSFPSVGSGISMAGMTTAIVDVAVSGSNPSCKVRPLCYNPVLNTYVAGETSDAITEPFRVLTPVNGCEDFYIEIVACDAGTIVHVAVAGV